MRIFQRGFNYSQDGQGNRLVFHLQGCNMRCLWCTNPEGLSRDGVIMAKKEALCDELCPHGAVSGKTLDRNICAGCSGRECLTLHRGLGLKLSCQSLSVEEVQQEAYSSSMLFYDGGGVTFTGGECTLQFDELMEILRELHNHHIHTAIETNSSHPRLQELFGYIDQLITDCKLIDDNRHIKWTGITNRVILQNIRLAAEVHPCVHVRVPLIEGVNNSPKDRRQLVEFFSSIDKGRHNISFEVLQYHEYGKNKWTECGLDYQMTQDAKVSPEEAASFRAEIEAAGLTYTRT